MDADVPKTRQDRYGLTRKKNITITELAHDQIEAWAEEHDYYFSVAIETLALIGMGDEAAALLPRLVENTVERVLRWQLNRLARVLALAATAAAESNLKVDALLLQLIRQEAEKDPEAFVQNMLVSQDPADRMDARIRRMRDEMKEMTRQEAARQMRAPLEEVLLLLDEAGRVRYDA